MKKTLLLLLLAVASAPAAFAQGGELTSKVYPSPTKVTDSRNTGFGVKGGYNYNNLRGDAISGINRDGMSGFHAGVYGQYGFNSFSSVQVELLYSRQGFGADLIPTGTTTRKTFSYKMDYVSLPVLYVGNFTDNLSFHIGPQASLLLNANNGNSLALSENGFHSLDYGGAAGLEARIGPARVGARYNLSLGKIFQTPTTPVNENNSVAYSYAGRNLYNNLFQLYVGVGITQ